MGWHNPFFDGRFLYKKHGFYSVLLILPRQRPLAAINASPTWV
ncbi:hypothetical protein swp_0456 [Shewanella piezotolerans WP3]|uniref:Uncharacterized protein n=1 Tax=Shewanella piezotolerans (strain WP3 / JCM 13877) TaxID=225849 RepID=B8CI11_SHEPW|nr:hypothetical protein swp_0456 [Shewanella piezotolerans WP3]